VDALVSTDSLEINVDNIFAQDIPLDISHQALLGFATLDDDVNDALVVSNDAVEVISTDGNVFVLFFVAVDHSRNFAGLTDPASLSGARFSPQFSPNTLQRFV
jgi:hypothetical protein